MPKIAFDIRRHVDSSTAKRKDRQREFDEFNRYMALVGDFTFRELLDSPPRTLFRALKSQLLRKNGYPIPWKALPRVLVLAERLLKLAKGRTAGEILCLSRADEPRIAAAIDQLRQLGLFVPLMIEENDPRQKYYRRYVMARVVRHLAQVRPRDLLEKSRGSASPTQREVIMEAKMMGIVGANSCGCDPPPVNNKACAPVDGGGGVCTPNMGSNCVRALDGGCAAGSDPMPQDPSDLDIGDEGDLL